MARFSTLLAVVAGLIASSGGTPTVDKRATTDLPPLTPSQIISSLTGIGLVKDINMFITNPLPLEFTIDQLGTNAGLNGTTFATFSHSFASPGLVVPALGTANSGTIDGVTLPQGALATLGIIPFGELDLSNLSASTRQITINGVGGLPLPLSGLTESSVPTVLGTQQRTLIVQNTVPFEITIDQLGTNAGLNGTTFLTFSHSFSSPGLIVPALGTANSGSIDNVALPQGALATFGIIPSQELDLTGLSASIRALTISGSGGIPIPLSGLSQSSVPTTYSGSALSGFPLPLLDRRDLLPPTTSQIIDALTGIGIFKDITMTFSLTSILTNTASSVLFQNPLPIQLTISQIAGDAGLNGTVFATFTQAFPSGLVIPALGSANSGTISNVALPQGVLPFLGIVSDAVLDITGESVSLEAFIIPGIGIPLTLSGLTQTNVPTTYNLGGL
ncbi:hypothetical protein CPB84DRAFT_1783237 [Gymnopilus junonius]|uniref:Uncharacterized protein n=1 Tax=Gymnopilus junonius TaxID=109634 RepID=A0A9P5TKQ0_GYMJU|nr:hypothetical protein CPB84DRAFT_1783237 [Gymnopilus junonius]